MITPRRVPSIESVGRHYDDLDVYYRDIWGEHVHHGLWRTGRESPDEACEELMRVAADAVDMRPGMAVCDVGCGYGGTSRYLAEVRQAVVTGLTVSEAQYQYAVNRANGSGNPTYLLQDWLTNRFPDRGFDALISIECLAHVPDKPRYFREIARVLKPGGKAAIYAWLAGASPRAWEVRHLLEPICSEGRLPGMGTADEYRQMIADAGLTLVQFEELSRNVRKTWWICARRLAGRLCTSRRYWAALFDASNGNRVFALTLLRILTAYHTGAMQYGLFVMRKD